MPNALQSCLLLLLFVPSAISALPIQAPACSNLDAHAPPASGSTHLMSIDSDGAWVLAGDREAASVGRVEVFRVLGDELEHAQTLTAPNPAGGDLFGHAVAVHGNVLAVGRPTHSSGDGSGAVHIFSLDAGVWQHALVLTNPQPSGVCKFGAVVQLSATRLVVGVHSCSNGAVYVYRRDGSTFTFQAKLSSPTPGASDSFGSALDLHGDRLLIGDRSSSADPAGCAHVFEFQNQQWNHVVKLSPPAAYSGSAFGASVALDGDRAAIGARKVPGTEGAVECYERVTGTWTHVQTLSPGPLGYLAGTVVELSGDQLFATAPGASFDEPLQGIIRRYALQGQLWTLSETWTTCTPASSGQFGFDLAAASQRLFALQYLGKAGTESAHGLVHSLCNDGACPTITGFSPASLHAYAQGEVLIDGTQLDTVTSVELAGVNQLILEQSPTQLKIAKSAIAPGRLVLRANSATHVAKAAKQFQSMPVLAAGSTGLGGELTIRIDNGDAGAYALALGSGATATPIPLGPDIYYGILIDLAGPWALLKSGLVPSAAPVTLKLPIPDSAALAGVLLPLQCWALQASTTGTPNSSFSNLDRVTLSALPAYVAGYWRFEESAAGLPAISPASIYDQTASGDMGTPVNSPHYSADVPVATVPKTGALNTESLCFDGVNDRVEFQSKFAFHEPIDATVEFWLKPEGQGHPAILWTRPDSTDTNRFHFHLYPGTSVPSFAFDYRAPDDQLHTILEPGVVPVPLGSWSHIAVTRTGNVYRTYVQGVLRAERTDSNPALPTSIGWRLSGRDTEASYLFQGCVDELRISTLALAPASLLVSP